jgi:hypothetical protein
MYSGRKSPRCSLSSGIGFANTTSRNGWRWHDDARETRGSRKTIELNRQAQHELTCENRLVVIPGATHPPDDPAAMRSSADLARERFTAHLMTPSR